MYEDETLGNIRISSHMMGIDVGPKLAYFSLKLPNGPLQFVTEAKYDLAPTGRWRWLGATLALV